MRIYLAAPWPQRLLAEYVAAEFVANGHTITHPWWKTEAADPGHIERPEYKESAHLDLQGVKDAEAVVALSPPIGGTGMWVEVGAALAQGTPVYLVGTDGQLPVFRSIFDTLCTKTTLVDLLERITVKK